MLSPLAARLIGEPLFFFMGMRKGRRPELKDLRRVLVVKLDELGDSVMLTPFVRELRSGLPQAWITIVVKPQLKELWDTCPYVNEVIPYDRPVGLPNIHSHLSALSLAKNKLWKNRFDLAIVPRWDTDAYNASFLAYFSGARQRVGYSEDVAVHKKKLNKGFDKLFTKAVNDTDLKHETVRSFDLLNGLGLKTSDTKTELWVAQDDIMVVDGLLASKGILPDDLFACMYPSGGSSVLKQWPAENFIKLGRWIHEIYGAKIIVAGGPGDEKVCREVAEGIGRGAVCFSAGLGLRHAAAVFKRCAVYVGNDTGPTHMAAAMGIPVMAIFGSSCPHRFAPHGDNCRIFWKAYECSPCLHHNHADRCSRCVQSSIACLEAITLEELKNAVADILSKRR